MRLNATCLAAAIVAFGIVPAATAAENTGAAKAVSGVFSPGSVLATSGGLKSVGQAVQPGAGTFSPLSAAECRGLGGKVEAKIGCAIGGKQACVTVDSEGVVRSVCLTQ